MNQRVKKLWVDALRSGEYRQDQWVLRRRIQSDRPVCCAMGVLCEIAVNAGVVERHCPEDRSVVEYGRDRESKVLPDEVIDWAGLTGEEVFLEIEDDTYASISNLNDNCQWSFEQIATKIEEQL